MFKMKNSIQLCVFFAVVFSCFAGSLGDGQRKVYSIKDDETRDFQGAQRYCESKGKTLANVRSTEEQELLEEVIIEKGLWNAKFWLGGSYSPQSRKFVWLEQPNSEITYGKWQQGGPRTGNNMCIMVSQNDRKGYRWSSAPCSTDMYFVCQRYQ